jgi:WD40 repeat protein
MSPHVSYSAQQQMKRLSPTVAATATSWILVFLIARSIYGDDVVYNDICARSMSQDQMPHKVIKTKGLVMDAAFSPDGKVVASTGLDQPVVIWDIGTMKELATFNADLSRDILHISFTPDGNKLVLGMGIAKAVTLWSWRKGTATVINRMHTDGVASLAISPDGKTLATGGGFNDHRVALWSMRTGMERTTLAGHRGLIYSLAFSPDGRILASGSTNQSIKLWELQTGNERATLKTSKAGPVRALAFSRGGQILAASSGGTIVIWNCTTASEVRVWHAHDEDIWSLAFSPDGTMLASGGRDRTIKLWDSKDYKDRRTLEGHTARVSSLTFSPDGKTLASGSWDSTIRLWQLQSSK